MKGRVLPHLIFLTLTAAIFLPGRAEVHSRWVFAVVMALIEGVFLLRRKKRATCGIATIVFTFFLIWELYSSKFSTEGNFLFPPPENVFAIFLEDDSVILNSVGSSFGMMALSFAIALALGIPLGLLSGRHNRLRGIVQPIAQVLSPIPGLIYAPYAVALMPSFWAASVFILSSGLFWPVLLGVIDTLGQMQKKLTDSAKALNLSERSTVFNVLLPYCVPSIFTTLSLQISNSFLLLVGAEMLGATSGVGWYVKYSSDFSDYTRVIAGFIVIGVLVSVVNSGLARLRKAAIRWQPS